MSEQNTQKQCRHCGEAIRHYRGSFWHQANSQIFPQYCRNGSPTVGAITTDGGGQLHAPKIKEAA